MIAGWYHVAVSPGVAPAWRQMSSTTARRTAGGRPVGTTRYPSASRALSARLGLVMVLARDSGRWVGEVGEGEGQVQFQAVVAPAQVERYQLGHPGQAPVQRRAVDVQLSGGLLGLRPAPEVAPHGLAVGSGPLVQQRADAGADPLGRRRVAVEVLEGGVDAEAPPVGGPPELRDARRHVR